MEKLYVNTTGTQQVVLESTPLGNWYITNKPTVTGLPCVFTTQEEPLFTVTPPNVFYRNGQFFVLKGYVHSESDIKNAIGAIKGDLSYDNWLLLGIAIHNAIADSNYGASLWFKWSIENYTSVNVSESLIDQLWSNFKNSEKEVKMKNEYIGIVVKETFKRDGKRKHWRLTKVQRELITVENARNYADSVGFFRDEFSSKELIKREETKFGYLPVKMESTSPCELQKSVRTFLYITE